MSETSQTRRVLHLVIEGFPEEKVNQLQGEVFRLTETNAREALEKIFDADTVAVWGKVD